MSAEQAEPLIGAELEAPKQPAKAEAGKDDGGKK